MGTLQFKNNASTTLSGSINDTQTSITVANASGFPSLSAGDYFYATMYETSGSTEINIEIVKVTATVGANWTVVRGQDGTTARSRNGVATVYVELRLTAASAQLMAQRDNNLSDLANAATARTNLGLGSIATQNANAVAITGGTISGVTMTSLDSGTTIQDNADPTKQFKFEASGIATATTRTYTVPNASGTLALTSDLTAGYQPLDSDLTAVAGLSANGLIARTGTGTMAIRAITQPAAGITVTNGDGVSGNPTLGLANDLAGVESLATTGFVRRTAADTWAASALVDGDLPSALTGKTYNGITPTANATGFSLAGGTTSKTLTVQNSVTLAGTDGTTITLPATTGTVALNNQTFFLGTTSVAINRTSGAISLTGVSIDGSAGSATSATSATTATNLASGVLGSVPYQSAAGATALLSPNTTTTRQFMRMTGTGTVGAAPAWDTVTKTDVGLSNVENTALSTWAGSANITTLGTVATGTWNATAISIAKGGTGQTTAVAAFDALSPATTLGDLIYSDGTDNVRLAGNTVAGRRFLRQTGTGTVSAAPAWDALVDGDIPSALTGKTYNGLTLTAAATGFTVAGGTTSKTLTVSNTLTLAGTDSSTLNIGTGGTLGSAAFTASTAYAPAAGSASILTVGTIGSGTWQGSAVGISYGGTGATSKTAGFNALSPVTTLGDIIYGDGANSNTRLAGNTSTSKRFLTQTGTGSVSAAPGWNAIVDGDIPSALTGKTYNGLSLTANATGFSVAGGTTSKTLVVNNNLTFSGTDGSTLNIGAGGTLGSAAYTASTAYEPAITTLSVAKGGTGSGTASGARTNLLAAESSQQSGSAYDFNNYRPSTPGLQRIVWNTGDTAMANSPNGNTTGFLLASQGSHDLWNAQMFFEQGQAGDIWIRGSADSGGTRAWGTWRRVFNTSSVLTGYTSGSNAALAATDTILGAFGKAQGQLDAKAALASPTFTGTPAAPTAAADTNTTQIATTAFVVGQASSTTPAVDGTAAVGTSLKYARADHVHGTDTSRAPLASPTFTGTPAAPTAAANTNTTQIATTAFVLGQGNSTAATIAMNGTQAAGSSNLYARADHVHPSDTSRAPSAGSTNITTLGTVTTGTWNAGAVTSSGVVTGNGGLKASDAAWQFYDINLDFGSDLPGTWRKIVTASLQNTQYSSIGFVIEITDPIANHAVASSANQTYRETYYVACVRTEVTTLDTPDACYVTGPGTIVRAVKTSTGNYEVQVQPVSQFREYRIRIGVYAANGTHTITFNNGSTAGAAGTAQYTATVATGITDKFQRISATSYNGLSLTANATGFAVAGGTTSKTLTVNNNLTLSGTDGSTLNIGGGGTLGTGAYATIANYATLASPTFTGTPAAPTAAVDTNTTQIATTAYVVGQGYLKSATASSTYLQLSGGSLTGGLREARVAMGASNIDISVGNYFTRTISGATTLTVSNVPAAGTAASFILDLTNGGSAAITWWGGMKWAGGTAPTLTAAGRDVLGFFTHDGGTTWTGLLLGKDVK